MALTEGKLPRVNSQKEFMDYLENLIHPPKIDEDELPSTGRLRELKTYILESNEGFPSKIESDSFFTETTDAGINNLKILRVFGQGRDTGKLLEFYLNTSDDRFLILHTNHKSDETKDFIDLLTKDVRYTFDSAWFPSHILQQLSEKPGNRFKGFGVHYSDQFLKPDIESNMSEEDLNMDLTGSMAIEMQELIGTRPRIKSAVAYNKIRISRGEHNSFLNSVQDDVHNTGYFSVKRGKSVQDHLQLVDNTKDEYSKIITNVEDQRIGVKNVEGRTLVEGKAFDFEFPRPIENLVLFIERLFSASSPFRLWGMKTKIYDGYFRILGVDLHTGSPMDFEISKEMMRVYLFKGNCGNTILRLFTNLQIYYDSNTICRQLN